VIVVIAKGLETTTSRGSGRDRLMLPSCGAQFFVTWFTGNTCDGTYKDLNRLFNNAISRKGTCSRIVVGVVVSQISKST
jgi:hypothetical protein